MDIDLERVFAKAVETGTALEINSQPDRLDLRDADARLAGERGVRIVVSTDAHSTSALDYAQLGHRPGAPRLADQGAGRQHAPVVEGEDEEVTFREDGHRAVDWAADYLERVGELPVLAQVQPGEIRARLPQSPPEQPEPFDAVLRDLDEILLPGVTHWQHPRFFAYFATIGAEPGILAELLAATLNSVGFLWRTAPASTELELLVCDWVAQLIGLPAGWHGHIEDTASTSTLAALIAARHTTGRNVVVCSEHAHSAADKAARMLGMELRKIPSDDAFRMRADALELDDVAAVVATVGTTSTTSVDPVPAIADRCAAAGHLAARRRRVRGLGDGLPGAALGVRGRRARRLARRQRAQMDVHADGLLAALDEPPGRVPRRVLARPGVPAHDRRGRAQPQRVRPGARPPLPLAEALGRAALLRRAKGCSARIREAIRLAELFEGWVRDEPGWELCAPRPFSVVCFRREGSDEENEAILERVNASGEIFISHTRLNGRYVLRLAIGSDRTTEDDVRRAWDVLRDLR